MTISDEQWDEIWGSEIFYGDETMKEFSLKCARRALAESLSASSPKKEDGVIAEIAAERRRQIEQEGWTPEHDDGHDSAELARAAACYALSAAHGPFLADRPALISPLWPWDWSWWKPTTPRRDLLKAAALIVAEVERLDRKPKWPGLRGGDDTHHTERKLVAAGHESDLTVVDIAFLLSELDRLRSENEKLKKASTSACFHYWNCANVCPEAKRSMAALARAIGYTDPAIDDEVEEALRAASILKERK